METAQFFKRDFEENGSMERVTLFLNLVLNFSSRLELLLRQQNIWHMNVETRACHSDRYELLCRCTS